MKKKQSKKRWAWTEAQKRKHWSLNDGSGWSIGPPSWYCRPYHRSNKVREKVYLHKIMKGLDPDELVLNPKHHHRSAGWDWW